MKKILSAFILVALVAGCVKPPEVSNLKPTFKVVSEVTNTYPGSSFRISITEATDADGEEDLEFDWSASLSGVNLILSNEEYAEFSVDLSVEPNQNFTVTGTATDGQGAETTASVDLSIVPEPFVIIDAETSTFNSAESHPIYLTGVYSAKAINLKSADIQDSDNYLIDVSPNGQFVFYTQLMDNADWVTRLYDATTDLNHTVNMSFTDVDELAIETYWSNDSTYLAIKMPSDLDSDEDKLLWFPTTDLTELTTIEPEIETIHLDSFVWSDNDTGLNETPYAAVALTTVSTGTTTTVGSMKVFNPASETPFVDLLVGTSEVAFSRVYGSTTQWANNQMFFIASTSVATTGHEMNLFRWKPSTGLTEKINGSEGSSNIKNFKAYKATQIAYAASNSGTAAMYYYDGVTESVLTTGSSTSATALNFDWSPNGRLLGIHYSTFFATWEPKNGAVVHLPVTDGISMYSWNWDRDYNGVSLINLTTPNAVNTLYTATTDEANSYSTAVEDIKTMSIVGTNVPSSVFRTLLRSPNGQWQLYWALKTDATDEHVDLWAYNTVTQEAHNISQLKEPFEAPVSEGIFTTEAGYDGDERKWVGTDITWINDNELVFKVLAMDDASVGTPEIVDIRIVSLETMATPRSIVLNPSTKTELTRVVGQ